MSEPIRLRNVIWREAPSAATCAHCHRDLGTPDPDFPDDAPLELWHTGWALAFCGPACMNRHANAPLIEAAPALLEAAEAALDALYDGVEGPPDPGTAVDLLITAIATAKGESR